jgi:hypothetical protein
MNAKNGSTVAALIVVLVCALSATINVKAQTGGGGSIQGTVTDPGGGLLPGATVVATNVATKVETSRKTNEIGLYIIAPLPPGEYTVTVSAAGFQTLIQEKVIVDALAAATVNLALKIGDVKESITVTEAPAQLNTSDARLGTTIRNELYTELPLAMGTAVAGSGIGQGPRNPGAFIFILPGVSEGNRWGTINGAQGFSKDVFIEGVPITDPIQQGEGRTISLGVSVEAVEQFQVETSGTGVEFNGQGSENYTIRSGGDQFHGSAFELLRNTVLDARGFFPAIRPVEHQNEFGFTIGGPIVKKKLFSFFSYDGWRYRVVSPTQSVSIPTLKERAGDFSELPVAIYDPLTTVAVPGGFSRTQFSDPSRATPANPQGLNIIPLDRISAISKVYQSFLPAPTSSGLQNNYLGSVPVTYNNDSFNAKVDYNLTTNQRVSGLYTHGKRSQPGPYREVSTAFPQSALPLPYTDTRLVTEIPSVVQLKHNWTLSSNLVNQASFGYNHFFVPITNATSDGKWSTKSGLKGLPPGDASDAFLEAAFVGPNSPAGWRAVNSRDFEDNNYNYTFQDSLLWVKHKHSFKFGFQYQRTADHTKTNDTGSLLTTNFTNVQTAGFNAAGTLLSGTGNAYASYLLGALNSATVNEDTVVLTIAQFSGYSWWVADDYKVNSRLTVNLGLRHDIMLPYTEAGDHFSFLDITAPNPAAGGIPGALRFGGNYAPDAISCHCSQIINTYYKAFGPRIGFAFGLNDKTVVRGGYGMMYSRSGAVGGRDGARIGTGFTGINANAPIVSPNGSFIPALFWDSGIPAYAKGPIYDQTYQTGFNAPGTTGGAVTFGDPFSQPPRYQNWNLSVQRALTRSLVVTAAYVGSNGKQLRGGGRGIYSNQMDPKYLVLGNLLTQTATAANVTAAAAIVPGIKLPFAAFSGTIAQMLRPFPQYNSVADVYGDVGQSNYNALQLSAQQHLSRGLTFNLNYTFSKALGTINGNRSAYIQERNLSTTDQPHLLNAFYSYELPFGKGRTFNPENIVVRSVVSGWQLSGITRFASGTPLGPFTATCNVPQAGTCWASYKPSFTGEVKLKGDGGIAPFINADAFVSPDSFTYGNTPATGAYGLRNPHFFNQDLNLSRNFQIRENLRFVFGVDSFNLFNNVRLGSINTNITNSNFGKAAAQTNLPRVFQFKLRVEF